MTRSLAFVRVLFRQTLAALCVGSSLLATAVPASAPTQTQSSVPWQDLFDGKTLKGWVQRGGPAKFRVESGCIVGATVLNTNRNGFLCTEKTYGDFIIEAEFLDDPKLNSGLQFRSECFDHDTIALDFKGRPLNDVNGQPRHVPAGVVHGYQVEIDPSPRAWTGAIHDEARRRMLVDLSNNEAGRKAFKQNEWNHLRLEAIGPRMRVWINGVFTAELVDDATPRGFIGIQVHQVGQDKSKEGIEIRFRNIRIQDLDAPRK